MNDIAVTSGLKRKREGRQGMVDVLAYAAIAFLYARDTTTSVLRILGRMGEALDAAHTVLAPLDLSAQDWMWSRGNSRDILLAREALLAHDAWLAQLRQGSVVVATRGKGPRQDREVLDSWGASSLILAPVFVSGGWWGFLAAVDGDGRIWSQAHRKMMLALAGTLAAGLNADNQSVRLAQSREHLREAQVRANSYRVKLDEFILASHDCIMVIEADGFVSRWNPAAEAMFGVRSRARPGRVYSDIEPFSTTPVICEMVEAARQGRASHARALDVIAGTGCRSVILSAFPLGDPGTVAVIAKDRTDEVMFRDKLQRSMSGTVAALASAMEARDPYTAGHQRRTAELARSVALTLGLSDHDVQGIHTAAVIHDIGKICVPAEILTCPRRLHDAELALIRMHCQAGHDIVRGIDFPWPVARMILQHHERMDGSGYPLGASGDQILMGARIIGAADTVEAITNHRPYRAAIGMDAARQALIDGAGGQFDPQVVEACLHVLDNSDANFICNT